MSPALQQLYASRPAWAVAATAIAVFAGAAGSLGLILRRRWATPLLIASLAGVVVQDVYLFMLNGSTVNAAVPGAAIMQGLVLLVAIGLVLLARKAAGQGWLK
jgi:anti-sigma-K factor RskA